jgi:predicted DNA-binding protein
MYVTLGWQVKVMGMSLKRTTVFLTEEQHERLCRLAFEQRTSMSKLIRDATLEILEDAEDINRGLKALTDEEGTVTWEEYQHHRKERELQGEL